MMTFKELPYGEYKFPPLAKELALTVAELIHGSPMKLNLPLPLLHDYAMTLTVDLLEASEISSPKFHGMTDEIPELVADMETRSAAANRMLYLTQIATLALCIAAEMRRTTRNT